jgi:short-subunit dehydrogenase
MFSYTGKTALITGAKSGIGEAFTQILAARSMNLVLVARSEEKLRTLAQALSEQHGHSCRSCPCWPVPRRCCAGGLSTNASTGRSG